MIGVISFITSLPRRQRIGWTMLAAVLVLGLSTPNADAQLTLGTIAGSIRDSQGAAIAGAVVSLVSETRGTKLPNATSEMSGEFVFPNVPPDNYTLEISHSGFKTFRRTAIEVSPGDRVGLGTLTIEVGATSEAVTVTAEATLLQTQSAERSVTITPAEVQNLPLASRIFTNLISVVPGAYIGANGPTRTGDELS